MSVPDPATLVAVLDAAAHSSSALSMSTSSAFLRAGGVAGGNLLGHLPVQRQRVALPFRIVVGERKLITNAVSTRAASEPISSLPSCAGWSGETAGRAWRSGPPSSLTASISASAALISAICAGVARCAASAADIGSMARRSSNSALTSSALNTAGVAPRQDVRIEEIPVGAGTHPCAGLRPRFDEPLARQHLDRLAQHGAADPQQSRWNRRHWAVLRRAGNRLARCAGRSARPLSRAARWSRWTPRRRRARYAPAERFLILHTIQMICLKGTAIEVKG